LREWSHEHCVVLDDSGNVWKEGLLPAEAAVVRSDLAQHYHLLREYMLEHPEAGVILGAID
jgi:hypothetical protein